MRARPARTAFGAQCTLALLFAAACLRAAGADTVPVAGGVYTIGSERASADARPAHRVTLAPFRIDRHEVTNRQFSDYLNALRITLAAGAAPGAAVRGTLGGADAALVFHGAPGGSAQPHIELDDSDARIVVANGQFAPLAGFEDHPVTEVTWFGARAYCAWRGKRLPSEAEWEAAARGATGRGYPWGEAAPTPGRALYGRPRGHTEPAGSRPAGATPDGLLDLAGSLAEWTSTLYRPYPYAAGDGRENPHTPGERVTRGGDYVFDSSPEQLRTWFRGGFSRAPDRGHRHIGFRCAL